MSWRTKDSERLDATAGADTQDLIDWLPPIIGWYTGACRFWIRNQGTATAYLMLATDTIDTALEIPPGVPTMLFGGEDGWWWHPDNVPTLDGKLGSDCIVTPEVRGQS